MHFVENVEYLNGYKLLVTFEDGLVKLVDLESYLDGEIFEPLREVNYFRTVYVHPDIDTIAWGNGADVSPNFLYQIGEKIEEEVAALASV